MEDTPSPHADWPRYRSHKVVQAAVISDIVDAGGRLTILVKPYGDHRVVSFAPDEPGMAGRAEVGGYAVIYDNSFQSISPKQVFEDGYVSLAEEKTRPLLMSKANPHGWALEDLLPRLRTDLLERCARLSGDTRPIARAVLRHNEEIVAMLSAADAKQRHTLELLNSLGPDPGPLGKPRVGQGS